MSVATMARPKVQDHTDENGEPQWLVVAATLMGVAGLVCLAVLFVTAVRIYEALGFKLF